MFHIEQNQMMDCMLNNPPSLSLPPTSAATNEAKTRVQPNPPSKVRSKRKRARATKTKEEAEKQRMTHIAVERNRRKQMNEHLQILRSLMPTSYAHRGDQASIVGGAIEFVRELEKLLQCLESVKREPTPSGVDSPSHHHQGPLTSSTALEDDLIMDQRAESKSSLVDVEVNLSGFFGFIKILSKRRPGQLIKNITALEHLHLHILQTNVTTIQEDVVCSFDVMMSGEANITAQEIANSIQQISSS